MNLLQHMKTYLEVVERGSLTRAAHRLKVSRATISAQIAALEKHVGANLLIRNTRSLSLSSEGRDYFELCKRVIEDITESEAAIGRSRGTPQGRVRVDMGSYFATHLVLPRLPVYLAAHPHVSLEFTDSRHIFDVEQIGCDVMLRMSLHPPENTNLVARRIGGTRVVFAASPAYLKQFGTPEQPEDLARHHCIQFVEPINGRRWEWAFERNNERFTLEVPGRLAIEDTEMLTRAAIDGMGIILGMHCDLRGALDRGELRIVLGDWSWQAPPLYLFYPRGRWRSAAVKSFIDFMLATFPPGKEIV